MHTFASESRFWNPEWEGSSAWWPGGDAGMRPLSPTVPSDFLGPPQLLVEPIPTVSPAYSPVGPTLQYRQLERTVGSLPVDDSTLL